MDDLTKRTLDDYLNAVAQKTPTPGGGSVAALVGASACALARMVVAYSVGKQTELHTQERMDALLNQLRGADEILRGLVTQDATAYEAMSAAMKTARQASAPSPEYQDAVLAATAVPLEAAAAASHALAAMDELKNIVNPRLVSDLGVAALLAEAAARTAWYMAATNLPELADAGKREKIREAIQETIKHCVDHSRSIENYVRRCLEST